MVYLNASEQSNYATFIAVQNKLSNAYDELREAYGYSVFEKSPDQLNANEIKEIKAAYPFMLSEASVK